MKEIKVYDVRYKKADSGFLIDNGETSILYDSGFGFTGYELAENVKKVLGNRKLDYIFLTHSHYDHVLGSAYVLRSYPEAKVVAGNYASGIFKRDGAKKTMKELDRKYAASCGVTEYEFLADELRTDICVKEGDIIHAGEMEFEVLDLPGHTKCSIGFYSRENGFFLSSETLGVYDGKSVILPSYLVSYSSSIKSIDKVSKLKIKNILMPHLGMLNQEQTDFFLNNMKSDSEKIAQDILKSILLGKTNNEIVDKFKQKYWHDYIKEIYPEAALELNTNIMIELIRNELM